MRRIGYEKIIKLYACLLAVLGLTAGCSDY